MKPILFNTEMVKAILDGRKTVTRRLVKFDKFTCEEDINNGYAGKCALSIGVFNHLSSRISKDAPCRVGDVLYVRETYCDRWLPDGFLEGNERYGYKAYGEPSWGYWGNDNQGKNDVWIPSIHMPKEAARIFLKVTDVRVERLHEMRNSDARKEGMEHEIYPLGQFINLWNSLIKKQDIDKYGWNANPFCWVIEFEWISKEDAIKEGK